MVRRSLNHGFTFPFLTALSLLLNLYTPEACAKKHSAPAPSAPESQTNSSSTPNPLADAPLDSAPPVVPKLEQRLFFKTYPENDLLSRIQRIEKQVFGESTEGPDAQRLTRLEEVLRQQEEADRKKQESESFRATMKSRAASATSVRPPEGANRSTENNNGEDQIERARISIQAAREQEISGLLAEGVNLYRQKLGTEAQEKFEQALRLDPHNAQAHFNLGIIEESMGNYVEAFASYKNAAESEPDNREYAEAVAAVEKRANAQQKVAGKRLELRELAEQANGAFKRGEYLSALDLYKQLDAKEPNQALVKYNIGSIYLMLKDHNGALQYYAQAHKLKPSEPKYENAYRELASRVQRVQKEQAQIDKETVADYKEANAVPKVKNTPKPAKTAKASPRSSMVNGINSPVKSPFAGMAIMGGGFPTLGGVPFNAPMPRPKPPVQNNNTNGNMNGMNGNMTGMNGNMTGMGGNMNGMGGNMTGMGGNINGMGGKMTGMGSNMTGMGGNMNGMGSNMNGMGGNMNGMGGNMNGMGSNMTGMGGNMNGMGGNMNGMGGNMNGMGGNMNGMGGNMTGMGGNMNGMGGNMNGMNGNMTGIGGNMTGMNGNMTGMNGNMTGMGGNMNGMGGNMNGMGSNMTGMGGNANGMMMNRQPTQRFGTMTSYGLAGRSNGQGVTVSQIGSGTRAAQAGLQAGDDIRAVDGIQISSPEEIEKILSQKDPSERITVLILRNGNMAVLNL